MGIVHICGEVWAQIRLRSLHTEDRWDEFECCVERRSHPPTVSSAIYIVQLPVCVWELYLEFNWFWFGIKKVSLFTLCTITMIVHQRFLNVTTLGSRGSMYFTYFHLWYSVDFRRAVHRSVWMQSQMKFLLSHFAYLMLTHFYLLWFLSVSRTTLKT